MNMDLVESGLHDSDACFFAGPLQAKLDKRHGFGLWIGLSVDPEWDPAKAEIRLGFDPLNDTKDGIGGWKLDGRGGEAEALLVSRKLGLVELAVKGAADRLTGGERPVLGEPKPLPELNRIGNRLPNAGKRRS